MSASPKFIVIAVVVGAVLVAIISLIATSLRRVQSFEIGLKYDVISRSLYKSPVTEGLHTGPPGFKFIIFPSVYRTLEFDDLRCLNQDGVTITLDISYQYQAMQSKLYDIAMQFKDIKGYEVVLKNAGQAAVYESCSNFRTNQFQTERSRFQEDVKKKIKGRYTALHAIITDLQVRDIRRPSEYESAVRSKEAARQNIEVAKQERPRKITQANTKLREAETQANITLAKAHSNARIISFKAQREADGIKVQYQKEGEMYKGIKDDLGLNADQLLSYIGVRTIANAKNPVYVGIQAPAKSSYIKP